MARSRRTRSLAEFEAAQIDTTNATPALVVDLYNDEHQQEQNTMSETNSTITAAFASLLDELRAVIASGTSAEIGAALKVMKFVEKAQEQHLNGSTGAKPGRKSKLAMAAE